jgi:biotin carboxyl carrier protein
MAAYQVITNGENYDIDEQQLAELDLIPIGENHFHLLQQGKRYEIEVLGTNLSNKSILLKVNGQKINLEIKDKYDLLVQKMGLGKVTAFLDKEIKAPMPGLMVEVLIQVGDTVEKGTPLLILEAMKMENMLKSTGDGVVQSVLVTKGETVEKNQVLITLD